MSRLMTYRTLLACLLAALLALPLASLLHDVLLEAIAHGDGESDWTALAKVALSRSGQI